MTPIKSSVKFLATLLCVSALTGTASAADCPDPPTEAGVSAFCGIAAPEDIVLYQGRALIVSSMEPLTHLYGLDLATDRLAPLETVLAEPADGERWGDDSCELPASLLSHGLDLSQRANGHWQLLVVNHGGRESIEYFALEATGDALPRLRWRGCVMAPENAQLNDVAGLPGGGFISTDPVTASWQTLRTVLGTLGMNTGRAYRWRPDSGYTPIPNTDGAYPNGILLSADGQRFYLNLYLDGEVREHDLETGELLRRVAIEGADNSSLTDDGRLLVASHHVSLLELSEAIDSAAAVRNGIGYDIVAVDLDSFEAAPLYSSDGESLGGGTVAQKVGDDLYIGAFRGDRMIRIEGGARSPR